MPRKTSVADFILRGAIMCDFENEWEYLFFMIWSQFGIRDWQLHIYASLFEAYLLWFKRNNEELKHYVTKTLNDVWTYFNELQINLRHLSWSGRFVSFFEPDFCSTSLTYFSVTLSYENLLRQNKAKNKKMQRIQKASTIVSLDNIQIIQIFQKA